MRELIYAGDLIEISGNQNIAYILNKEDLFFLTGYKVLQGQEKNGFIKCARLKYNGKTKLLYLTSKYKSFASILSSLDPNSFMKIVANLLSSILDIKTNGFLNCFNIDIAIDKIFIDYNTLTPYLIYLPLNITADEACNLEFENELRTNLIKVINSTTSLNSEDVVEISSELANGTTSLENLYKMICEKCKGLNNNNFLEKTDQSRNDNRNPIKKEVQPDLHLTLLSSSTETEFIINQAEYILGKNPKSVDGVITFNNAISRVHCKIVFENSTYYVMDLGSANGTFVNGERVIGDLFELKNGDILKLANSEFNISI